MLLDFGFQIKLGNALFFPFKIAFEFFDLVFEVRNEG
jgi:hypothetical protein